MRLTLDQIKAITVGALRVWEEDEVFRFAKCTQKQENAWFALDEVLGSRSMATTGVRLDFYTNSKFIAFTPQIKSACGRYEIYVDNIFKYYYGQSDFAECKRKEIGLDGNEHRITLYLPAHEIGSLECVEIEDGATVVPPEFERKILFIGDSITQGWDSTYDSLSYAQQVSRFLNAESIIQGIGGGFFHNTVFDEAIEFDPDIVVVAFGTNDWMYYKTVEEGKMQCSQFLEQIQNKYGDKKVFGISPIWRGDKEKTQAMGEFEECATYVKEEIRNHHMTLVEGEKLVPHLREFFLGDIIHPNTSGFGIYALNLIDVLTDDCILA